MKVLAMAGRPVTCYQDVERLISSVASSAPALPNGVQASLRMGPTGVPKPAASTVLGAAAGGAAGSVRPAQSNMDNDDMDTGKHGLPLLETTSVAQ